MAGRWRNGYRDGARNGGGDGKRLDAVEHDVDELQQGQILREEQIRTLRYEIEWIKKEMESNDAQYRVDKAALALEVSGVRDKIDTFKVEFGDKLNSLRTDMTLALTNARAALTLDLDKGLRGLDKKFDENKNYFTRYFIIILVTILVGLVVGGAAFVLNR